MARRGKKPRTDRLLDAHTMYLLPRTGRLVDIRSSGKTTGSALMIAQCPRVCAIASAFNRAFSAFATCRPARQGSPRARNSPTALTTGSRRLECHALGFVSHRETSAWNPGSKDDRIPRSASHLFALSQSSRAGMTQRAIRIPSYLKRPSCPWMKPTVARRFSHWDNVPTLQGLHSQPSKSSPSAKCRPPRALHASLNGCRLICPACQLIFTPLSLVD